MEILFDNPFIIIILIAALSSMFKNKKKSVEAEKRGTGHTPAKKSARPSSPFDEVKEIFKEVARTIEERQEPAKRIEEVYQEKKYQADQFETFQQTPINKKKEYISTGTREVPGPQTISAANEDKGMEIDKSTIVDAVIWAEILGPPRAKNPYRKPKTRS